MLLQACGFPGASVARAAEAWPQGFSGASRGLQGPWARLKFHAGWSGWTRPPTMAGGGAARSRGA